MGIEIDPLDRWGEPIAGEEDSCDIDRAGLEDDNRTPRSESGDDKRFGLTILLPELRGEFVWFVILLLEFRAELVGELGAECVGDAGGVLFGDWF